VAQLDRPLDKAIGPKVAKDLASAFGMRTVDDLVRHYPRRYEKLGELTDLAELRPGADVTIQARVVKSSGYQIRPKLHKLDVDVTDGSRSLRLVFFNSPWRKKQLEPGVSAFFAGEVTAFKKQLQMTNPVVHLDDGDDPGIAGELIGIYSATKQLASWKIRRAIRVLLETVDLGEDPLPEDLRRRHELLDFERALIGIHLPESWAYVQRARARLKWDEALFLQLALAQRRAAARANPAKPRPARPGGLLEAFDAHLPFALTDGQVEVSKQIFEDMEQAHPMNRLLQGEVGSGKTVVAVRAMLAVIDSGGQAALLAPTEVLAQQHYRSITELLGPLAQAGQLGGADVATRVALVTGSLGAAARRTALLDVASGASGLVIGTHALLEENVQFADIGLVVVDEQHRFGVEQREALRAKGVDPPHVLVMTATPIPRTVAMTVYGDLDVSTLRELPMGRRTIQTSVVPKTERPDWMERVWERVREEVAAGRQAYVVCPRIGAAEGAEGAEEDAGTEGEPADDETDDGPRRPPVAVLDTLPMLAGGPLAGLRIDVMHGRLPADEKDAVMRRFTAGETDVLVSTTVIEVGVDVANATVMVVLDADRFGVSQLHQMRGRVGRGEHAGLCLLVTDVASDAPARERLEAVAETLDGFRLSELDLEQRREGDVLGATQAGRRSSVRLLSVLRDADLITDARAEATALVEADPQLADNPVLARTLQAMLDPDRADYLEKT
jgi:ATP-dependent DNA helicase RecG